MTPDRRVAIETEYLRKFELIFGAEPDADRLAKFDVITHGTYGEASLLLALETWLLNGPRTDHVSEPQRL